MPVGWSICRPMRCTDGGGWSAVGQARREVVRLEAARMFERDAGAAQVAREPRYGPRPIRIGPRAMNARLMAGSPGGIHSLNHVAPASAD
jgi:hypothetical protein